MVNDAQSPIYNPNVVNDIIAAVPTISDTPNTHDTPSNSGVHNVSTSDFLYADCCGGLTWFGAQAWVGYLNSLNSGVGYLGYNDWRLPVVGPVNGSTFNYSSGYDGTTDRGYNISMPGTPYAGSTQSEMAHLFYNTLGNIGFTNTSGVAAGCPGFPDYCLTNTGPFSNLEPALFWSGTEYAPDASSAWFFDYGYGVQTSTSKTSNINAWVVRPGDVATVPVPAAVWLFGSGLLVLTGVARRKAA
jgi:hypothetical protein